MFLVVIGLLGASKWKGTFAWVTNLVGKKEIVVPLPRNDPGGDLERLLRQKHIAMKTLPVATNSSLLVQLPNETEVLFSPQKDLSIQVSSLQIIINKITIEGKSAKKIDLRFAQPIVVY